MHADRAEKQTTVKMSESPERRRATLGNYAPVSPSEASSSFCARIPLGESLDRRTAGDSPKI